MFEVFEEYRFVRILFYLNEGSKNIYFEGYNIYKKIHTLLSKQNFFGRFFLK